MSATLEFGHLPLSLLTAAERAAFDRACDIVLFERGDRPLREGEASSAVYFVINGRLQALRQEADGEQALAEYGPGDVLGAFAVMQGRARFSYEVREDALCHAVDAPVFLAALQSNPRFAAWFQEGLAAKRDLWQRQSRPDALGDAMLTRVGEAQLAPAIWLHPDSSLQEARRAMKARGVSCVLVRESDADEPGIVTRTDLLDALALGGAQPTDTLRRWVRRPLCGIGSGELLFQGLVDMTEQHVERLVVRDSAAGGAILGTLGVGEVLSHFSSPSHLMGLRLARAESVEEVQQAAQGLPALVRMLFAQGARMSFLMELVSALNTRLFRRLYELIIPGDWQADCCVLVLGSEGRREQILRTDQDNALIHPSGLPADRLATVAEAFSAALIGCGFPPCPGGVMLRNPHWRAEPETWRERFASMASSSDPAQLLDFAILLDARPVAGDAQRFESLRPALLDAARNDILLHHFAAAVLAFETPLTLFRRLRTADHRLDIKKGGIFPLVHGLRALALRARLDARNSFHRAAGLVSEGMLGEDLGRDVQQALAVFHRLRLGQQLDALGRGDSVDNALDVDALSRLDRELLRDALGVVASFKLFLSQQFRM